MKNYIVHSTLDKTSELYVHQCIEGSLLHADELILLTCDPSLHEWATSTSNVSPILPSSKDIAALRVDLDSYFYHDGINPRSFDFNCFLRHLLVSKHISVDKPEILVFQDSDILLTERKNLKQTIASEVSKNGIATRTPQSVYFSGWTSDLYADFASIATMKSFFEHCAHNNIQRCSDMTYF